MADVIKRRIEPIMVSGQTLVMISLLILAHSSLLPRYCEVRTKDATKKANVMEPVIRRGKLDNSLDPKDGDADELADELELILSLEFLFIYPFEANLTE
jgi:hypothetical protein